MFECLINALRKVIFEDIFNAFIKEGRITQQRTKIVSWLNPGPVVVMAITEAKSWWGDGITWLQLQEKCGPIFASTG